MLRFSVNSIILDGLKMTVFNYCRCGIHSATKYVRKHKPTEISTALLWYCRWDSCKNTFALSSQV